MSPVRRQLRQNEESRTHECPHPACGQQVPREMFACREHWFALPPDLRQDITLAWQIYRASLKSHDLIRVGQAAERLLEVQSAAEPFWRVGT